MQPGVYFALSGDGTVLYIGSSLRLGIRWTKHLHRRHQLETCGDVRLAWLVIDDPLAIDDAERVLIAHVQPVLNRTRIEPPRPAPDPWAGIDECYWCWGWGVVGLLPRAPQKTSITRVEFDFVWIPVRRRKVLVGPVAERLEVLRREAAERIECDIQYIAIQPDHVHLFVAAPPTLAPDQIMFRLKGDTSHQLREEFPALRKMPSLWTRSYFCATAGMVSSATIQRYIEEQSRR
jgi:putative transposase